MHGDAGVVGDRRPYEGRIDRLVPQPLHQTAGSAFLEAHRYARRGFPKRAEQARHDRVKRRGARESDNDAALFSACGALRRCAGVLDVTQYLPRLGEQGFAGIGQRHAARQALEQLYVEFRFQRANLLAERGLPNSDFLGGARYMAFLGHGDEVP